AGDKRAALLVEHPNPLAVRAHDYDLLPPVAVDVSHQELVASAQVPAIGSGAAGRVDPVMSDPACDKRAVLLVKHTDPPTARTHDNDLLPTIAIDVGSQGLA